MKHLILAAAAALVVTTAPAYAADPAPAAAPAPKYSTSSTTIGDLVDNAETKAVLEKHMPGFASNPQLDMARSMTMKQIQGFAGDAMSDEVLAKIDADLAAIK